MGTWRGTVRNAALSGAVAGLLSAATARAATRKLDRYGVWRALNGSGQPVPATRGRAATTIERATLPSIVVQQLSSLLWTTLQERTLGRAGRRTALPLRLLGGVVSAATAYGIDHAFTSRPARVVPDKLPSRRERYLKYALIGVGVTVGGILLARKNERPPPRSLH